MRGWRHLSRVALAAALALPVGGCFEDRARPSPVDPTQTARLSVQLLAPRTGITVATGSEVTVTVTGRDLDGRNLTGVGFVARRFAPGTPVLDSASVQFAARADSTHQFVFRVPTNLPTNTQVDVYGVAFGPGARVQLSGPSYLVVVNCATSNCPSAGMAWSLHVP